MELVLGLRAQLAQGATGFKQRGAKPRGEFAKRRAISDGARLGHTIEIIGWDKLGVHGEGGRLRQVQLMDLLPDITGDKLDGGLHFRHDALSFLDALQAALAEPFVLGNSTNLLDVPLDISGNELTVSTHPALEIDKMVGMADATDALSDLLALLSEALVLTTGRFECLRGLLQAHGGFWGPARTALFGLVTCALLVSLHPFELFHGFSDGLVCSPLFRGHGTGDCFDQLVLHMEQVW